MKKELKKIGGEFQEFFEENCESQHYNWLIPCYFKPIGEPETSKSSLFIHVNTVATSKVLTSDRSFIDFGEISVGFRKIEEVLITNRGDKPADLHMDLLPLFGGFHVLNALRRVEPGKTCNVVIQFEPHNQQAFKEQLRIYCKESSISIKLYGKSVKPEILIDPENEILDLGGCVFSEKITKNFEIKNVSNFELSYKLNLLSTGIQNSNGLESFLYTPSEGTIPAYGTVKIEVTFRPDKISENYFNLICIDVPNQKNTKHLFVRGFCYSQ